jgi:hypothetical protein
MKPIVSMRAALGDPDLFGKVLAGESWALWRVLLIAICGEALTDEERVAFEGLTGRPREAELVTIKASGHCSTDQERKRDLSRKIAHFGQAIKGRGQTPRQIHFVGVTIYEKKRSGALHAHMLVHVEKFAFAKQLADGNALDVIRARVEHRAYITKQRLPFSPEVEATHWHLRQASEKISGVRLSYSADAKALIASQRSQEQSAGVAALPARRPMEIRAA